MGTVSHNPLEDTGVKMVDANGVSFENGLVVVNGSQAN